MTTRSILVWGSMALLVGACGSNDAQPLGGNGPSGTGGSSGSGSGGRGTTDGGGGADGAAANPVVPTQSGTQYALGFGDVTFVVDANVGARITTLSIGGANLLTDSSVNSTNWGSTFWTSPQSAWKPSNWPPVPEIDNRPYGGAINNNHIVLDGTPSSQMGVSVSKDFSADAATGWITLMYTIHASSSGQMAPWQVTRLFPGGLVFFPSGTAAMTPGPLNLTTALGTTWFDSATLPTSAGKAYGDGSGGWVAYVRNGILFLQKFNDVPADKQAPSEGEVEIYAGQGLGYFELELQGPYTLLAAGDSLSWTVSWRVVPLPDAVKGSVAVGSQALLDFVQQELE
jgi:hypothetical protein